MGEVDVWDGMEVPASVMLALYRKILVRVCLLSFHPVWFVVMKAYSRGFTVAYNHLFTLSETRQMLHRE